MEQLFDAHAHLGEEKEQEIRQASRITTLVCATTPEDAEMVAENARRYSHLLPTFGLHPWYADRYPADAMLRYLDADGIVGEIGLDSVWCEVAPSRQMDAFLVQMDWAQRHQRPVILHTKGQEQTIGAIIQRYTMPIMVHWYSCAEYLSAFLNRDCYFTIGPDVSRNPVVQQVARAAPLHRLLIETDGLSAVQWALGDSLTADDIPGVLANSARFIAGLRGLEEAEMRAILWENALRFRSSPIRSQMEG